MSQRLPTKTVSLVQFQNRLQNLGITDKAEIIVANHMQKTIFGMIHSSDIVDELKAVAARRVGACKAEVAQVCGTLTKVNPEDLAVTPQLVAHMTNAKTPLKQRAEGSQAKCFS